MHRGSSIKGDGIDFEIFRAVQRIIDASGVCIKWEEIEIEERLNQAVTKGFSGRKGSYSGYGWYCFSTEMAESIINKL
jgi:hypothetical protein